MTRLRFVLAAGGTGGHIFPAVALAQTLTAQGHDVHVFTDARSRKYLADVEAGTLHVLRLRSPNGNILRKALGVASLGFAYLQARRLLGKIRAQAVIGFGGYPSFPVLLAAGHKGIPCMIHEQNAILGRANRILARHVNRIATSFPETEGIPPEAAGKAIITGTPVRQAIAALRDVPYPALDDECAIRLLVLGGSQGATVFSEVVPSALATLSAPLRERIRIDQQCREADIDSTRAAYKEMGINADLATFFKDVPARLAAAHLVISRAGASTVAELMAAGRPAVLVPYPHAKDDHQTANANAMEDAGCGWLMPEPGFTPAALATRLESFLTLPEKLQTAAANARSLARTDAAGRLADLLAALASGMEENHPTPETLSASATTKPMLKREKAA